MSSNPAGSYRNNPRCRLADTLGCATLGKDAIMHPSSVSAFVAFLITSQGLTRCSRISARTMQSQRTLVKEKSYRLRLSQIQVSRLVFAISSASLLSSMPVTWHCCLSFNALQSAPVPHPKSKTFLAVVGISARTSRRGRSW